jgi:hypothetical protein
MAYPAHEPYGPPPPERPLLVTVVAVLGIAMGAMGLLSVPVNIVHLATGFRTMGPMGPSLMQDTGFGKYMLVMLPVGMVASAGYLAAGIGMLKLRPWARKLAIGMVIYGMLSQIAGPFLVGPMMTRMFSAQMAAMPTGGPDMSFMGPLMQVMVIGGSAAMVVAHILILILLTRPDTVAAFSPPGPALPR